MVDLAKLDAAAKEAAAVDADLRAAFEAEHVAAAEVLSLALRLASKAFGAISHREKFFGVEQHVVHIGNRQESNWRAMRQLYMTATGGLLEQAFVFEAATWKAVDLHAKTVEAAASDYEVEKLVSHLTRLCAGVVTGNADKRAGEARARADRLHAVAVLIEAVAGLK